MESPNTCPQAIELNPSCLGQAHSKKPGPGFWYETMESGCILVPLHVPSTICPLRSADAKSAGLF